MCKMPAERPEPFFDVDAVFDFVCLVFLICLFGGALLKALSM